MNDPWDDIASAFATLATNAKRLRLSYVGTGEMGLVHILVEVERRTWQLNWLVEAIRHWDEQSITAHLQTVFTAFTDTATADQMLVGAMEATNVLELHFEAFYVTAFRLLDLARKTPLEFRADGVRDVRNHMIIHPEGADGVLEYSFSSGGGVKGPVLKPARDADTRNQRPDAGFLANANQLAAALEPKLAAFPRGPAA